LALGLFAWSIIDANNLKEGWGVMTSVLGHELSWGSIVMPVAGFIIWTLLKSFIKIIFSILILIGIIYALVIFS
jgi:hypothetical protein